MGEGKTLTTEKGKTMIISQIRGPGNQREVFRCDVEIDGFEVEVYGEIDDNHPVIWGVEGMDQEEIDRREPEIYDLVMVEWPEPKWWFRFRLRSVSL